MNWETLKTALLNLPQISEPIRLDKATVVVEHDKFLKTQIAAIDSCPQVTPRTHLNNTRRRTIAKPCYDRLLTYYNARNQI
jgi:hypothetical protein